MKKMMKSKVMGILVMILAAAVGGTIGFFSFVGKDSYGELFLSNNLEQIIIVVGMVSNMNLDEMPVWVAVLLFVAAICTISSICVDIRCVALFRKVRPEITANPICLNYGKEYMSQIDELEVRKVGEAAMHTVRGLIGMMSVFFLLALLFQASLGCYLVLGGIWVTLLIMFQVNARKVEKRYKNQ